MPDNDREQRLDKAAKNLQSLMDEIHNAFRPQWEARASSLKTIITLSSGSIVLSNTFSSSLRSLTSIGSVWRWLILSSFVLLVVSLISAFIALWFDSKVYELQSSIYVLQSRARDSIKDSAATKSFLDGFEKLKQKAIYPPMKADTWATRLFKLGAVSFCVAILLLAVVGIRQFSL